ncbi:MAG: P-II family nitrogen regulator [Nitrosopumilus sp.]|nr:MAG: P-II family nitrogen regulator [Nitrosopumilus sp.]
MKRIEAIVQSEISKQVVNAIRKKGTEGVTLIQSLGQGDGERPEIGGHQIEFNSTDITITVIPNSKVESVVSEIIKVAHTGRKGDGKVFGSEITESYDMV